MYKWHGWIGSGTVTPVRASFRTEMEQLKNAGAPAHRAAGGALTSHSEGLALPTSAAEDNPVTGGRLSVGLGREVKRAAP